MPALARTATSCVLQPERQRKRVQDSLRRHSRAASTVGASSRRIANSSPPMRAAVSASRTLIRIRPATATSSSSPAAWPRLSFTALKSSRSRNRTASGPLPRRVRVRPCASRSRNSARFGRPVRESWNAWWRSCCSSEPALRDVAVVDDDALDRRDPRGGSSRRPRGSRYEPSAWWARNSAVASICGVATTSANSRWMPGCPPDARARVPGGPTLASGAWPSTRSTAGLS